MARSVRNIGFSALLVGVVLLTSCATAGNREYRAGQRDFDAGNYIGAVDNAVQALRANRDHEEALPLLRQALPRATELLIDQISQLAGSSEPFAGEGTIPVYRELIRLHNDVAALTVGVATENYEDRLADAREAAAEERYTAGATALANGGFENARRALDHFRRAAGFVEGFRDTSEMISRAEAASLARLYVHVTGDNGDVARRIGEALMDNSDLAQVTELVAAGTLGTGNGQNASAVISQVASAGVDLLLFVSLDELTVTTQGFAQEETQLIGRSAGLENTAAFSVVQQGVWQIHDVATRAVRSEDTFRIEREEALKYSVLVPTGSEEMRFPDSPPRTLAYADMSISGLDVVNLSRTISRTTAFVDSVDPDTLQSAGFNDLTAMVDGVLLHPGVYGFNIEGGSLMAATGEHAESYENLAARVRKMEAVVSALEENGANTDTHVATVVEGLPNRVVQTVSRATAGHLSR